jgi:cell division protein FtsB
MEMWDVLKGIIGWVIVPLVTAIAWFAKNYVSKVEQCNERISHLDKEIAVLEAHIKHIRSDVEEIRRGIDRILTRM